jgi:hypothetical protein
VIVVKNPVAARGAGGGNRQQGRNSAGGGGGGGQHHRGQPWGHPAAQPAPPAGPSPAAAAFAQGRMPVPGVPVTGNIIKNKL